LFSPELILAKSSLAKLSLANLFPNRWFGAKFAFDQILSAKWLLNREFSANLPIDLSIFTQIPLIKLLALEVPRPGSWLF
jgi:hypothetical protein